MATESLKRVLVSKVKKPEMACTHHPQELVLCVIDVSKKVLDFCVSIMDIVRLRQRWSKMSAEIGLGFKVVENLPQCHFGFGVKFDLLMLRRLVERSCVRARATFAKLAICRFKNPEAIVKVSYELKARLSKLEKDVNRFEDAIENERVIKRIDQREFVIILFVYQRICTMSKLMTNFVNQSTLVKDTILLAPPIIDTMSAIADVLEKVEVLTERSMRDRWIRYDADVNATCEFFLKTMAKGPNELGIGKEKVDTQRPSHDNAELKDNLEVIACDGIEEKGALESKKDERKQPDDTETESITSEEQNAEKQSKKNGKVRNGKKAMKKENLADRPDKTKSRSKRESNKKEIITAQNGKVEQSNDKKSLKIGDKERLEDNSSYDKEKSESDSEQESNEIRDEADLKAKVAKKPESNRDKNVPETMDASESETEKTERDIAMKKDKDDKSAAKKTKHKKKRSKKHQEGKARKKGSKVKKSRKK
ncbi:hypothetical protein ACOME3_001241 [Neoechinorhynchus agilis]